MQVITQSEAQAALDEISDGITKLSVQGGSDRLCSVTVFNVRVWNGEEVDWKDVMFVRKNGKVRIYDSKN
jgi:hypothetical protein